MGPRDPQSASEVRQSIEAKADEGDEGDQDVEMDDAQPASGANEDEEMEDASGDADATGEPDDGDGDGGAGAETQNAAARTGKEGTAGLHPLIAEISEYLCLYQEK